ncbi:hypothetical protein DFP73DRAFT_617951 [Morchella snyderi]|nr:hypothetical protein DFP73DRAFT_617951 [Morchella snyderi]
MAFIQRFSVDNVNFLSRMPSSSESRCLTGPPSELSSQQSSQKLPLPPTETSPFNISPSQDLHYLETPLSKPELSTLSSILAYAVSKYGDECCFASRKVVGRAAGGAQSRVSGKDTDGSPIEESAQAKRTIAVGEWKYLTYNEVGKMVPTLSAGLTQIVKGRLHMFGRNSANWFMLSHAASMSNIPLVTLYPNSDKWIIIEILLQTHGRVVFVDSDLLGVLSEILFECPNISTIIYDQITTSVEDIKSTEACIAGLKTSFGVHLNIISLDQLHDLGNDILLGESESTANSKSRESEYESQKQSNKDRIWGIVYPLSNGKQNPLGVLITIGNMTASIANIHQILKTSTNRSDTYLSYLPLAFMLEYNLVNAFLLLGVTIGFGTNGILYLLPPPYSDLAIGCSGDIESFEPSILFGIPAWWDMIHGHVLEKIKEYSNDWQERFWKSAEQKPEHITDPIGVLSKMTICALERSIYLKPIREKFFGTRMRWLGVSCSMHAREKREFLGAVLSSSGRMVEVFSFMALSTMVTFMPPSRYNNRNTGMILPSLQIKLVSVAPDHFAHGSPPRGEIFIRGPSVPHMGYFKNPEASIAAFLDEGWVKTGIVAEWSPHKRCPGPTIIGSVNSLERRYIGDYVPLESLEAAYKKCRLVQDCCIIYSGRKTKPLAVIAVNETYFRKFCDYHLPNQTPGMQTDEILLSRPVNALVLNQLNVDARSYGVMDFELIGGAILVKDKLPKDSQRQKVKNENRGVLHIDRKQVRKIYAAEIEHEFS